MRTNCNQNSPIAQDIDVNYNIHSVIRRDIFPNSLQNSRDELSLSHIIWKYSELLTKITMVAEWHQGLFGCFSNIGICIMSFFVPCYVHGKNAEAVGDDCLLCGLSTFVPLLNWYTLTVTRGKVRDQRGIPGEILNDALVSFCCAPCTLAQESGEMRVAAVEKGDSMARL